MVPVFRLLPNVLLVYEIFSPFALSYLPCPALLLTSTLRLQPSSPFYSYLSIHLSLCPPLPFTFHPFCPPLTPSPLLPLTLPPLFPLTLPPLLPLTFSPLLPLTLSPLFPLTFSTLFTLTLPPLISLPSLLFSLPFSMSSSEFFGQKPTTFDPFTGGITVTAPFPLISLRSSSVHFIDFCCVIDHFIVSIFSSFCFYSYFFPVISTVLKRLYNPY